jgi:hypothetical protein
MKKIYIFSMLVAIVLEYPIYKGSSAMVGCGLAPNGKTYLGACYSIMSGLGRILVTAIVLITLLSLIRLIFKRVVNRK